MKPFCVGILLLISVFGCIRQPDPSAIDQELEAAPFRSGAEVLTDNELSVLDGLRVGLIVNHTARVDSLHLIDILHRMPGVELAALFGPEHGIRGENDAGASVEDGFDERTGVPVYSLYHGDTRKPDPEALQNLDALVFDIQDIGARFYTYISTMGLAMQAAAESGLAFIVLDRPNPLGGNYVSGFVLEDPFTSFVGQYPIPIAHGLTVGELASLIKGDAMLEGLEDLDLKVVQMEGWQRSMIWSQLGKEWIPTSPNIPDFETALVYPGTCFFEAIQASEGRGTRAPFLQVGAAWIDAEELAARINAYALPGLHVDPVSFVPEPIAGMSSQPRFQGQRLSGVSLDVFDEEIYDPVLAGVYLLHTFYEMSPDSIKPEFFNERWMNLLAGTDEFQHAIRSGKRPEDIAAGWAEDVAAFKRRRAPYLLYTP